MSAAMTLRSQLDSVGRSIAVVTALLVASRAVTGQVAFVERSIFPPQPEVGGGFGRSLMVADLDQDGFDDLVVGEARADVNGVDNTGRLWILRGPIFEGAEEVTAAAPMENEELGWIRGTIADVDDDGDLDLVAPAPFLDRGPVSNLGRVHAFSGRQFDADMLYTPTEPQKQEFGYDTAFYRDASGRNRLAIGAPRWAPGGGLADGVVYIFDIIDGGPPEEVGAPTGSGGFGNALHVSDLDDDGVEDLLVSEPLASPGIPVGSGLVHILDGATEQWLAPIQPPAASPVYRVFGEAIHAVTDLDGDGVDDLFLSASGTEVDGTSGAGVALVLAGPDFTDLVHEFKPLAPVTPGQYGNVAAVGDLDLDGLPDVIVGDPAQSLSEDRAYVHYGPEFEVVQVLGGKIPTTGFGRELQVLDWDGDGCDELVVSADWGDGRGVLYLYDPRTLFADRSGVSVSQGGTVDFGLDFPDTHAGREYRAVLGLSGSLPGTILGQGSWLPLNLDALTITSIALANGHLLQGFTGTLDSHGNAAFALVLPPGLATPFAGQTLNVAAVLLDGGPQPYGAGSSPLEIDLTP